MAPARLIPLLVVAIGGLALACSGGADDASPAPGAVAAQERIADEGGQETSNYNQGCSGGRMRGDGGALESLRRRQTSPRDARDSSRKGGGFRARGHRGRPLCVHQASGGTDAGERHH